MNSMKFRRTAIAVAAAALLPFSLAACSDSGDTKAAPPAAGDEAKTGASNPMDDSMTGDEPFGAACAGVPKEGAGSFDGMAKDPVATAASNNPALSTLVSAVKQAGLVDTLNNAKDITVFAPTNDAFAKIPKADLDKVLADKATLTKILTYHVVGQKLTPKQLENGSFETLQKGMVNTAGSGEAYKVNDTSNVVCGNVKTANANVYIVDTVLMPK
ncbi:fasciclin domain-containing protein [Streptomyces virginiae]|uniref:Lipoprotein n=1 Tax=Streptomyces virginiae TaxID=1961 RepID=A0ABQ3NPV7_STRVG|nr:MULTISPECIES: fasciclin domain-containing protein [Streptomyces]GLV92702.1 lipoprotein [Streptomyces lavendulae subsp. lavendulae]MBP2341340.1 putative surface protein with fasciclin (FAS1) repeats/predicted small lipoprotein YifL [Streptomyces virginiae]MCI4079070.1 fasciclin domain-containing protein [Streptomyces sp. MMS21 TC-5]GGQ07646.1 lipoprotein [Streptomyces virginiae]GHI14801.1 lipoprotein [Streptomyces virginiae]